MGHIQSTWVFDLLIVFSSSQTLSCFPLFTFWVPLCNFTCFPAFQITNFLSDYIKLLLTFIEFNIFKFIFLLKNNCFTEFCCLSLLDFNFFLLQICILHSIIIFHVGWHFLLNSTIILTILTSESLLEYSIRSNYCPYFFCVHVYICNLMDSL